MKIAITNEIVLPNAAEIENELKAFNWSPCGRYLLAGSAAKMIKLWDVEEEEQIHCIEGLDYWPTSSTWSPDGSKFAVGFYQDNDDYNVKVFNTDSGECIQTLHKHSGNMFDVCWTNDNNLGGAEFLWSGSGKDALAMMWEPLSGQAAFEQQHPNEIRRLIPSADHSRLLVGCWPQSIVVWKLANSDEFQDPIVLHEHQSLMEYQPWSPDGSRFIAKIKTTGDIAILESQNGEEVRRLHSSNRHCNAAYWSPDGSKVVVDGDGGVMVFAPDTGEMLYKVEPSLFSPSGDEPQSGTDKCGWLLGGKVFFHIGSMAFTHHEMRFIDAQSGEILLNWVLHYDDDEARFNAFEQLAVSPDGCKMAIGDSLNNVFVLEVGEE